MKIKNFSIASILLVTLFCFVAFDSCDGNETATLEVTVRSGDLRVDEKKGEVIWERDQGVKRATYRTYVFPLDHFKEKLGHPRDLKGEYKLKIETKEAGNENYVPADPSLPQPEGGFHLVTFSATILESLALVAEPEETAPVRKLDYRPDWQALSPRLRNPDSNQVTLVESADALIPLIGEASAKKLAAGVDFTKENVVLVNWITSGPPFGILKYEFREKDAKRSVVFYGQSSPTPNGIRGEALRNKISCFGVDKAMPVSIELEER